MVNQYCKCKPVSYPFQCTRHCRVKNKIQYQNCQLNGPFSTKLWNTWESGIDRNQGCSPEEPQLVELVDPLKKPDRDDCGCSRRKAKLNSKVTGLGDLVERFTTVTGLKRLVNWWYQRRGSETAASIKQQN